MPVHQHQSGGATAAPIRLPRAAADRGPRSGGGQSGRRFSRALDAALHGGEPLRGAEQRQLQTALGADLSKVRLHTDDIADELARSLSAVAFTTGEHVFVRDHGQPLRDPGGAGVLTHEVAHTIQQARGAVDGEEIEPGLTLSTPGDCHEVEAASGRPARAAGASPGDAPRSGHQVQRLFDSFDDLFAAPAGTTPEQADQDVDILKVAADSAKAGYDLLGPLIGALPYDAVEEFGTGLGVGLDAISKGVDAGKGERSVAGTISEVLGTSAFEFLKPKTFGSPWETAAKTLGAGNKVAGGPQELTEAAEMFAKSTGTGMAGQLIESGARAYGEIAGGGYEWLTTGHADWSGLDQQMEEIKAGKAGPLQGYAMAVDLLATGAGSGDWDEALRHATASGESSLLAKAGGVLGDEAFGLVHGDADKSALVRAGNFLGDEAFGLVHGDSDASSILAAIETYEGGYGISDWVNDEVTRNNAGPSSYDATQLGASFDAGTPYDPRQDMGFLERIAYDW